MMCKHHHALFDGYEFFIRFIPEVSLNSYAFCQIIHMEQAKKFILINYSDQYKVDLAPYHGKAIALDITDIHTPFPSLFIIHEMRVRGYHPFHDTSLGVPDNDTIDWQDWVKTNGVWDNTGSHFHRHRPGLHNSGTPKLPQMPSITTSGGGESSASGTQPLELNEKVIADILAATHAMPSWKECEMEGTRWMGTAEENKQKYLSQDS
jgi:hypothetical protein